jgi:hypothetical protein
MTVGEALEQLKAFGNEKVRAQDAKNDAGGSQFGVKPFAPIWINAIVSRRR